jgi:hypothetical protein
VLEQVQERVLEQVLEQQVLALAQEQEQLVMLGLRK